MVFALFFGISITRKLSAVHRLVLDSGRSIIVWAVSMILGWQQFQILQIVGFILMITGVLIFNNILIGKVEKILEGNQDLILSPSPSVKIQTMGGKVCLRCKGETLLCVVNKFMKTKSLLIIPSNVLPLCLKQTFPPIV